MRKGLAGMLAALLAIGLAGCAGGTESEADGRLNVVTTIYPLYFLASEIGGEKAHVVNLIPAGVEPHDWSPKSKELQLASKAQVFLYNGAGLEGWTEDFLSGLGDERPLMAVEASRGITLLEGSGAAHSHGGFEDHQEEEHEDADHHHLNIDPHTWVSPRSMLVMAGNVRDAFVEADRANEAYYEKRYDDLKNRLEVLDRKFSESLAPFAGQEIVVSHQAFGYLARDYGLRQVAVMGLSPDAEPRAQDLLGIIQFMKEKQIRAVFFEELGTNALAERIAKETGAQTLVLNPAEGLTPEQEKTGDNYLTLMERNLQNLLKALQ
jgi:zinc transport system substrate-binding protein